MTVTSWECTSIIFILNEDKESLSSLLNVSKPRSDLNPERVALSSEYQHTAMLPLSRQKITDIGIKKGVVFETIK